MVQDQTLHSPIASTPFTASSNAPVWDNHLISYRRTQLSIDWTHSSHILHNHILERTHTREQVLEPIPLFLGPDGSSDPIPIDQESSAEVGGNVPEAPETRTRGDSSGAGWERAGMFVVPVRIESSDSSHY